MKIATSVNDLIGKTPLFRLLKLGDKTDLLIKLEQFNAGGNVKDRAALNMIMDGEKSGRLRPGGTIIEVSSGNTGTSLAMIGASRRYRVIIIVDEHVPKAKVNMMKSFGAEIRRIGVGLPETDQASHLERDKVLRELAEENPSALFMDQGNNPSNPQAHYLNTANEILEVVNPDYFFATVGTGGTISGTGKRLLESNKHLKIIGVEPHGSIAFGGPLGPFYQSGSGSTYDIWENINFSLISEVIQVHDRHAFTCCRFLARHFGLSIGGSGGALVYGMIDKALRNEVNGVVVGVIPDSGIHYLDTIFDDTWIAARQLEDEDLLAKLHQLFSESKSA